MSVDKFGRTDTTTGKKPPQRGAKGDGFNLGPDGHFDLENKRIKLMHDPVDDQDAVTKKYIQDNFLKVSSESDVISLDGKRLVNINFEPKSNFEAASKFYVDKNSLRTVFNDKNAYDFSSKKLSNVGIPTSPNDVTTLHFVEAKCEKLKSEILKEIEPIVLRYLREKSEDKKPKQ